MGKFVWPSATKRLSRGFNGSPNHVDVDGTRMPHDGLDIACPSGSKVWAARPGVVTFAGWNSGGYGNYIQIKHGNGVVTFYGHLSRVLVSRGQKVNAGQVIGLSGSTGKSTGPHLHFGMHINGRMVNPAKHVKPSDTKAKYTGGTVAKEGPPVLQGTSVPAKIWRFLMKNGFSTNAASAIMGCWYCESGLHPGAIQSNGAGHGLGQWSSGRWTALQNFAKNHGWKWNSTKCQLEYFKHEAKTSYSWVWDSSFRKSSRSIDELTNEFMTRYEGPGVPYLAKAISHAKNYYNRYHKYTGTSGNWTDGSGGSNRKKNKPITKIKTVAVSGKKGKWKTTVLYKYPTVEKHGVEVLMQHGSKLFEPAIDGAIEVEWTRRDSPGKMTFTVLLDDKIKIAMGDAVRFRYDGKNIFLGYLFQLDQTAEGRVSLTYYDQLRYFKNKDLLKFKKATYSSVLKQICRKYNLRMGEIANTKIVLPAKLVDGTLFDALGEYSTYTTAHSKNVTMYILYDDFGRITLKPLSKMRTNILIDAQQMENFQYTSSIDDGVYNCVKLYKDDSKTGTRKVWVRNDTKAQAKWGLLTYVEKTDERGTKNIMDKAKIIANLYDDIQRSLTLQDCIGDINVRGGSIIDVQLKLQDKHIGNEKKETARTMVVETVTHKFQDGLHTMDLKVVGGAFNV